MASRRPQAAEERELGKVRMVLTAQLILAGLGFVVVAVLEP
jgi:hypothetical protein